MDKKTIGSRWAALLSLVVCCLVAGYFMVVPPVFVIQKTLIIWPVGSLHAARWGLLVAVILLACGSFVMVRRAIGSGAPDSRRRRWLHNVAPLSWLPLCAVVSLLADRLPGWVVANGLFFLPILVVSVVVNRMMGPLPAGVPDEDGTRRWALWILVWTTLFFTSVGWYLSATTGEHVGDEGHYLIQAQSLFFDHDLDIKNNFLEAGQDPATISLEYIHISPQSKDGHWYSWHPHGLSVLLAPFWPGGMPLRQFILGLISGIGCVGIFLLSRRMGASLRASLAALLSLAGSAYWALYSARSLPEVLGASLLVWVFWAIAAQKDRPWGSLVVAAVCCIYLPFAHIRFLPLSLMGFGLYGLFRLCSAETWARIILRLGAFSLLCLAGAAVFFGLQRQMFATGASYGVSEVLFSYPMGAWAVLADSRGVTSVFPLFPWLVAAWIAWVAMDRKNRWFALGIGATILACLLTCCTNGSYTGGSSIPGRYALVVIPLLIPAAACVLDRASIWARWWFVFLGLVSAGFLAVILVRLPEIGRAFTLPFHAACNHPLLQGLFFPHSMFLGGAPLQTWVTTLYVVSGILFVAWLLIARSDRKAIILPALATVVAVGIASHRLAASCDVQPYEPGQGSAELSKLDLNRATVLRRNASKPVPLFEISREVFRDTQNPERRATITTQDLGVRRIESMISQPRLENNDWAGRGFRWTTLTAPFAPARGLKLMHVSGRMEGKATVVFVIREGGRTLFEGPLPVRNGMVEGNFGVQLKGKSGHLYLLARLENGEGVFHLDDLSWSPYSDRLLQTAKLQLPANTAIIRQ